MAIDDNTIYGLYGSQIKDLPERINAVKGLAKVLTTDDYNWPTTGTKTSVALWLLEPGIYTKESGVATRVSNTTSTMAAGDTVVVSKGSSYVTMLVVSSDAIMTIYSAQTSNGQQLYTPKMVLNNLDVIDTLVSTATARPLSANQGRVLKSQIGDLTALDTTVQTDLVSAINEVAAGGGSSYVAGDGISIDTESGAEVISATNTGIARELTSADYNWPTNSPDGVALWLLDPGVYYSVTGVNIYTTTSDHYSGLDRMFIIGPDDGIRKSVTIILYTGTITRGDITVNGSTYSHSELLDTSDLENDLTASVAGQKALDVYQGKVLKDMIDANAIAAYTTNEWNALWA